MKWKLLISFIFIMAVRTAWCQADIQDARRYMQEQEYTLALPIWESCAQDTAQTECIEQAAIASSRLGYMSQAKNYFHQIEKYPDYFKTACINLASIYEQQENIPKAIKYNSILRDSFPENPIYYRKIGNLLMKAALPKEAFSSYAKALSLNPDDVTTIRAIADILVTNAQYTDADSLLKHGLSIDSTNVGLSLLLARNYYKQRMYDSTVMVMNELKGVIDFSNYFNKMYGYSLLQIDSVDESIFYLEKSLVNEGDPEYAHYYLGNAYELKGDMESAIFHLRKAIETGTSPGLKTHYRNLARILNSENILREAIPAYEWAYRYDDDPLLLFYLGRASDAYYKDKSIAIRYYTKYINSKNDNEEYKQYARERKRYLLEYQHQSGNE
jgi:tetratricopeptide (TPR) repeat protein